MMNNHLQVAFITGRSRPNNWSLSPVQTTFLQKIVGAHQQVMMNFPWTVQTTPWTTTGLLRASINNTREYFGSRSANFALRYRQQTINMLTSANHTLLLSGSCGLELFNQLHLEPALLKRVSIFAYGPVARQRPSCQHLLVQGKQDWISRCWFRHADKRIDCGHMNYLEQPQLLSLCNQFIEDLVVKCSAYTT